MSDRVCTPLHVDHGWAYRTAVLIEREERLYVPYVHRLVGDERAEPSTLPPLTHQRLLDGLEDASDPTSMRCAAFVAGRCTTGDPGDDESIARALAHLVEAADPMRLRAGAAAYVEAVMSSALLHGSTDRAHSLLTDLVLNPDNASTAGYLAAYYLAQLGSAAGYPVLHADLHNGSDAHARGIATRHLLAFVPYDGHEVDGITIDVRSEFVQKLRDRDDDVASEVPELMAEAGLADLETLLRDASKRPYSKEVREAATWTLNEWRRRQ